MPLRVIREKLDFPESRFLKQSEKLFLLEWVKDQACFLPSPLIIILHLDFIVRNLDRLAMDIVPAIYIFP